MQEYTLIDFDIDLAQKGATLCYQSDDEKIHFASSVDFNDPGTNLYAGFVFFSGDRNVYGFYRTGECYNHIGQLCMELKIANATITKTTGTKIARVTDSDGTANARPISRTSTAEASEASAQADEDTSTTTEEVFSIATLQPREEIAMHCLGSMIGKYDNPLNIDNAKIKILVSKAFLFAQEFINQSVLYREKETTSSTMESNQYASVDSQSLSSDTDKLLYNIATALTNIMAQSKNQYADQQKNGLKVNTADINIKAKFPDELTTHVDGTIKAEVSGSVTTKQETQETKDS